MAEKIFVNEIVEREAEPPEGSWKETASLIFGVLIDPIFLIGDLFGDPAPTKEYVRVEREVDPDTIQWFTPIDQEAHEDFYKSGALTTLWDKSMRPIHVAEPSAVIRQFIHT